MLVYSMSNARMGLFKFFILGCFVLFCGIGFAHTANAARQDYRTSCTDIHITSRNSGGENFSVMDAMCSPGVGDLPRNYTEIKIPSEGCARVYNEYGTLHCIPNAAKFPGGSWSQSCVEGRYIRKGVFQAVCAPNGTTDPSVYTSINMLNCPSFNLENINGRLRCE